MTELKISGMTCGHCQTAVKNALEAVDGVERVEVSLEKGLAKVEGEADVRVLVAAVEEEGYEASLVGRP
jgi:copper chaperone